VSQLAVWDVNFPGGIANDNIKWRAFVWGISELMLVLSISINYLSPKWYKVIFRFSLFIIMLDFFLSLIWLPIGVHNTYGFRSAKFVFTSTCTYRCFDISAGRGWVRWLTGGGAEQITERALLRDGIGFCLCEFCMRDIRSPRRDDGVLRSLFTSGTLTGFDASGHVAEETKHAKWVSTSLIPRHPFFHMLMHFALSPNNSVIAGRGIITSAIATGVLGFITTILFLFCIPDLDTFFSLNAPQPFVLVYALALGKGPSIFMTIVSTLNLIMVRYASILHTIPSHTNRYVRPCINHAQNTSIAVVASSRLIFAIARDGVLPLSSWIGRVNKDGQPQNAVTVMFVFAAVLLCSILPSQVAFTSLISGGAIPTIAAYGLIALLRLTMTPHAFKSSHFYLGRWACPMYVCTVLFNGLIFAVRFRFSACVRVWSRPSIQFDAHG
jgi:hypothetical protein